MAMAEKVTRKGSIKISLVAWGEFESRVKAKETGERRKRVIIKGKYLFFLK